MPRAEPYTIVYAPIVAEHLHAIEPKYHTMIADAVQEQLSYEPQKETRNRKPLRAQSTLDADWEIRFGPNNQFRAFYRADEATLEVHVAAIGVKERDRLFVGGEELFL